jgi:Fe-S-cluster-containing dehydrogenase component
VVTVKRRPRYINEELCTGCQECIDNCVYKEPKFPDEFNEGLGKRKPIHIPFPQATPQVVLIDPDLPQLQARQLAGSLQKTCVEACGDRKAIDFTQKEDAARRSRSAPSSSPPGSRPSTPARPRSTATAPIPTSTPPSRSSAWSTPPAPPAAR